MDEDLIAKLSRQPEMIYTATNGTMLALAPDGSMLTIAAPDNELITERAIAFAIAEFLVS